MLGGKVTSCHIEIHSFMCGVNPFCSLDGFIIIGKKFLQIVNVETPTLPTFTDF